MAVVPFRNKLAYPAGALPGIDPDHPASQNLQFSAIATGKNMISLTQGIKGTIVGAPSFALDGAIGPAFVTSGAVNCSARFAGHPAAQHDSATIAGIVKVNSGANTGAMFMSSGIIAGYVLYWTSGDLELAFAGPGTIFSGLPLVQGVPYFYIASAQASVATNFLTKRLDTGVIATSVQSSFAAPNISDGTYTVGDDNSNDVFGGNTATVMFATNYMTMPEMRAFADDPWAFWYPPQQRMRVAAAAAATAQYFAFMGQNDGSPGWLQMIGY